MKPILVMQVRRLGDLILTFPLLQDLQNRFAGHPLRVVGQPSFYEPLKPFAPDVQFFSHHDLPALIKESYEAVINLGGPEVLGHFTAQARASVKLGPVKQAGNLYIKGFWQLYRASLTSNNRHNPFHWADLFQLDWGLPTAGRLTESIKPRSITGKIGLFIGASEVIKRPEPLFWARLARKLADLGYKPVLLGGPQEAAYGQEVMAKNTPALNFCGKTTLTQLGKILENVDLLVTPDTGPMHLANLLRVPVFNLSMGNVKAGETGPYHSGQHILRSALSCVGCWECERENVACKSAFSPYGIAKLVHSLINSQNPTGIPKLELLCSSRDEHGLYHLKGGRNRAGNILEAFWKAAFLHLAGLPSSANLTEISKSLADAYPQIGASMNRTFQKILKTLSRAGKGGLPEDFWRTIPLHTRLYAGFVQMSLQNESFSATAIRRAIEYTEKLHRRLTDK